MEKKSVLEQALLEAQQLEEAVKSNAKEILASTMKQEIEELVKESLNEQDEFEDVEEFDEIENEDQEEEVGGLPDEEEEAMVSMEVDSDEPLDLTTASDDEVLKVFKSMGAEDGIVVTQDDNVIDIEDQEAGTSYKIELAENKLKNYPFINEGIGDLNEENMEQEDIEFEQDVDIEPELNEGDDDETLYEIELDERGMYKGDQGGVDYPDFKDTDPGYDGHSGSSHGDQGGSDFGSRGRSQKTRHEFKERQGDYDREHESMGMRLGAGHDDQSLSYGKWGNRKKDHSHGWGHQNDQSLNEQFMGDFKIYNSLRNYQSWCKQEGSEGCDENDYKWNAFLACKQMGPKCPRQFINKLVGADLNSMETAYKQDKNNPLEGVASKEQEVDEASRTTGFGSKKGRGLRKAFTNNRNLDLSESRKQKQTINEIVEISKKLQNENRNYKAKNKEYRNALKIFRGKLNEVAVFNANLAYSTKLFTEHTTTKKEKINILRRFDNVKTLNESKSLYRQISSDLGAEAKSLTESVQKTITKTPSRGSSINLIETKTYENPQITRMKEIMSKL